MNSKREALIEKAAPWIAHQHASGWTYWRAVYAAWELGVAWPREDPQPECLATAMRSWWSASRWSGGGLSPEDVRMEIDNMLAVFDGLPERAELWARGELVLTGDSADALMSGSCDDDAIVVQYRGDTPVAVHAAQSGEWIPVSYLGEQHLRLADVVPQVRW